MRILRPDSLGQAVALLAEAGPEARLAAGSTALQAEWSLGKLRPPAIIDISRFKELTGIDQTGSGLRIGANETLSALIASGNVSDVCPLLIDAARRVGAPSIRHRATLGGNIGWRIGCLLPALLALDAELELQTSEGVGTLTLEDWLSAPSETSLITAVRIPRQNPWGHYGYRKIGLRAAFTPSVIAVSGAIITDEGTISAARVAVGGGPVAATRLATIERELVGQDLDRIDQALLGSIITDAISAPGDAFRTERYRKRAGANALVSILSGAASTEVRSGRTIRPAPDSNEPDEIRLSREQGGNRWHIRPDLPAKIAAEFPYLTDVRRADMLVGATLRLDDPHARILSIDTEAADALPGVKAVVTHRDIRGENSFGILFPDQPALCSDKVRYLGDPVAAVAAVDRETAIEALSLIKIEFERLPPVGDPLAALGDGAEAVHDTGNLVDTVQLERGDVDAAFAKSVHVIEDTYVTPRQMHGFMETEGGYAEPTEDGGLAVFAGGQYGVRDRKQLSRILGMPEEKIRVVTSPTGGGFGGKDELTVQPVLALLALKANAPVRMQWTRAESVLAGTKRNPFRIRMRTACDAGGMLLAQEVEVIADSGAYASLSPGVMETASEHACGPYITPNVKTFSRLAYTNNGACGAFRGFGANQMTFAVECQMDRLAAKCGLDPVEIRRRNLRKPGMPGFLGQPVAPSERLEEMLQAAAASPMWQETGGARPGEVLGTGMALIYQGNGLGTIPHDEAATRILLAADGRIEAHFGLDEMGQGLLPSIQAAVADRLGCAREDIRPVVGDTSATPDSGSTTASRGGYVVWKGTELMAPPFEAKLLASAGKLLDRAPESLRITAGGIADAATNSRSPLIGFAELAAKVQPAESLRAEADFAFPKSDYTEGNARFIFAFGVNLAHVAIDRVSGEVRVLDLELHTAAGPVIDLAAYLGQMEGGLVQGLGFALTEDVLIEDGHFLTTNYDNYFMPTVRDAPGRMTSHALEDLDPGDPFGPRGAGEIGINAVTPAIANAVADALGRWPTITPFRPEDILDYCEAAE
ncbi:molybdopterin cofactor-binding domain-containing protein [Roseibium marinum]|uniref:Xanthine dehydrogenase D subunit/xanthine dehydrogenase C subunit,TIGR03199 n=1 Tax=Roseibium marinum TaxID=281252 RepID=A0A2S3UTD2_9HYPH|nr:molybdopterin cofactor-binding domain-containing protein [Roseibium marinum]POF30833.1 xanthine dehydrogenase D subunit/xanthine dehydrogenase C subunit,TIGR03199 [Roseibium marinum]